MNLRVKARVGDKVILTPSAGYDDGIRWGQITSIGDVGIRRYNIITDDTITRKYSKYEFIIMPLHKGDIRGGAILDMDSVYGDYFYIIRTIDGAPDLIFSKKEEQYYEFGDIFAGYEESYTPQVLTHTDYLSHPLSDDTLLDCVKIFGSCLRSVYRQINICGLCEDAAADNHFYSTDGTNYNRYCRSCAEETNYTCYDCHNSYTISHMSRYIFRRNFWCARCFEQKVFTCSGCDEETVSNPSDGYHGAGRYCLRCYDRVSLSHMANPPSKLPDKFLSRMLLDNAGNSFEMNKSKTPASLEIELIGYEDDDVEEFCPPNDWRIVSDGSLTEGGVEMVMTPKIGDYIGESIKDACEWASEMNLSPDGSCGVHVHTNALDLGVSEMKGIILTVKKLEDFIYQMVPQSREFERYSKRMADFKSKDLLKIVSAGELCKFWYEEMGKTQASDSKYNESRYRGLNVHSRFYMGTIEYRYHEGSRDPNRIFEWTKFCLAITDFGKNLLTKDKKILNMFLEDNNLKLEDYLDVMGIIEMYNPLSSRIDEYKGKRGSQEMRNPTVNVVRRL